MEIEKTSTDDTEANPWAADFFLTFGLAHDSTPAEVAERAGCTTEHVTRRLADPEFVGQVEGLRRQLADLHATLCKLREVVRRGRDGGYLRSLIDRSG